MKFVHQQPFRTPSNEVITSKAIITIHGSEHVECYENKQKYIPDQLTPMTQEEYQGYIANDLE